MPDAPASDARNRVPARSEAAHAAQPARVLVTRPAEQASVWVSRLRESGFDAVALPLIGIEPALDQAPLANAWTELNRYSLVMFVSPNAARLFFDRRPADKVWPASVKAGSPGPGTTDVLRSLGVPNEQIVEPAADAAQFDSETLWIELSRFDWRGSQALIVRGQSGREWLADKLRAGGAAVTELAAYRRGPPAFDHAGRQLMRQAFDRPSRHVWLFSSSVSIEYLAQAEPGAPWPAINAIATHPTIAATARRFGCARVDEARPSLPAVVAALRAFDDPDPDVASIQSAAP